MHLFISCSVTDGVICSLIEAAACRMSTMGENKEEKPKQAASGGARVKAV